MYVKFTAEHIGRTRGTALVRDLEAKDFCVSAARMDPVFENQLIIIVNCDKGEDVKVRDAIFSAQDPAIQEKLIKAALKSLANANPTKE